MSNCNKCMDTKTRAISHALLAVTAFAAIQWMRSDGKANKSSPTTAKKSGPSKQVFPSKEESSKALCQYVASAADAAIKERGVFYLAVAGGSLLDALAGLKDHKDSVDFSKVVLSFANHKCVPLDNVKSTIAKCKTKFADEIGITKFVTPSSTPQVGSDGSNEAQFYATALRDAKIPHTEDGYPQLDLILLGLGADGHVGSCHPMGPAVLTSDKSVAGSPKEGEPSSITLTIESMNAAHDILVVVSGGSKGKKEAVKRAMARPAEEPRGTFPAQLLAAPTFFLDTEAAADL